MERTAGGLWVSFAASARFLAAFSENRARWPGRTGEMGQPASLAATLYHEQNECRMAQGEPAFSHESLTLSVTGRSSESDWRVLWACLPGIRFFEDQIHERRKKHRVEDVSSDLPGGDLRVWSGNCSLP